MTQTIPDSKWPPAFTIDQERILNLLTGDRFYTNASAALRESILNAIDAVVHLRRRLGNVVEPAISVTFNSKDLTLTVGDNGEGMDRSVVTDLFAKIGASVRALEDDKGSVGEFGIGVISYFMASDSFTLQTYDGLNQRIGLRFTRQMLAGGNAEELPASQESRGTTLTIAIRDVSTFSLLLESFPYWCRDVDGLTGVLLPEGKTVVQGGFHRSGIAEEILQPDWVERAHLCPISDPSGWDAMTGISTVSVLYRGVFVQDFSVKGAWGIEGSIDVDPKHFKPRLNREGFVEGQFQAEVEGFLRSSHPTILKAMARRLADAVERGVLDKWTERRWATLWLSVPRDQTYASAAEAWDLVFQSLPAFELAVGNKWEPLSLLRLLTLGKSIFVAPHSDEKATEVVQAALRLLRNTGRTVIRGIRRDPSWLKFAGNSFGTTADLIASVFAGKLPELIPLAPHAEKVLAEIARVAQLFSGPPPVDLVRLSGESPPVLRLQERLVINIDHPGGRAMVKEALVANTGPSSLIAIAAVHAYEQLTQVAAAVKDTPGKSEILGLVKKRYIRSFVS